MNGTTTLAAGDAARLVDRSQIRTYLGMLWPFPEDAPDTAYLVVWEKKTKTSRWHRLNQGLDPVVDAIAALAPATDVYLGVSAQDGAKVAPDRRSGARGTAASALLLPALFVDLDVAGPGHASTALPPSVDAAVVALREDFPLPPTMLVATGGGLHAYWCLKEPLDLSEPGAREVAAERLWRLEHTIRDRWRRRGWTLDPVAELARVLRPAGTANWKDAQAPRRVGRWP